MTEINCPECGFENMDKTDEEAEEDLFCHVCGNLWKIRRI